MHRMIRSLLWALLACCIGSAVRGIPIESRILDTAGQPLAVATVRLERQDTFYQRYLLRFQERLPEIVAKTRSGADGYFRLEAPEPGLWLLEVSRPGHATLTYPLEPLFHAMVLPETRLPPAEVFEVRVRSSLGQPIAGARLAVLPPPPTKDRNARRGWRPRPVIVGTGQDGRTSVPRFAGQSVRLEAWAAGYRHQTASVPPGADTPLVIEMLPDDPFQVAVQDAAGRPLAGVLAFHPGTALPLGQSDADGHLTLSLPTGAPVTIDFLSPRLDSARQTLTYRPSQDGEGRVIRLIPPDRLHGRVRSGKGQPVADALVWVAGSRQSVTTDPQGRFSLPLIAVSQGHRLKARADGHGERAIRLRKSDLLPLGEVLFSLPPSLSLSGRIVDQEGRGVAAVSVSARPADDTAAQQLGYSIRRAPDRWTTRSGQDGRFYLSDLPDGPNLELVGSKIGYPTARWPLRAERQDPPRTFVLEAGVRAQGSVVSAEGMPAAGAEVVLRPSPSDPATSYVSDDREGPLIRRATTDTEGVFVFDDTAAGRFEVEVRFPDHLPGVMVVELGPEVRTAAGYRLGEIRLEHGTELAGKVTDRQGRPIPGVAIRGSEGLSFDDWHTLAAATSVEDGSFRLAGLPSGRPVWLRARADGFAPLLFRQEEVPAGEDGLQLTLLQPVDVEGKVVNPDGRPVEGARVSLQLNLWEKGSHPTRHLRTDAEGRFRFAGLPPRGAYLSVRAAGFGLYREDLKIPEAGFAEPMRIVLRPGTRLMGTVRYGDGEPAVDARVGIRKAEGFSASASTDAAGRFEIDGVPPGLHTLAAQRNQGPIITREIAVGAAPSTVELTLPRGIEVHGVVEDPLGEPLQGAYLSLQPVTIPRDRAFHIVPTSVMTRADGSFDLPELAAGIYRPQIQYRDQQVELVDQIHLRTEDSPVALSLRLPGGAVIRGKVIDGVEPLTRLIVYLQGTSDQAMPIHQAAPLEPGDEFHFEGVPAGSYRIHAPGNPGRFASASVRVEEGVGELEVVLEMESGPLTLSGTVSRAGLPVAGARVAVSSAWSLHANVRTDDHGAFHIPHLRPGFYDLQIDYLPQRQLKLVADRHLTLELTGEEVHGRVLDSAGETVAYVQIQLFPPPGRPEPPRVTYSRSDGSFRLEGLEPGSWTLVAGSQGYGRAEAHLDLPMDGDALELILRPAEVLSFTATIEGQIPERLEATLTYRSGKVFEGASIPDADGRYRISPLPAGDGWLELTSYRAAPLRRAVTVPGDLGHLRLALPSFLELEIPELAAEPLVILRLDLTGPNGDRLRLPFHRGRVTAHAGKIGPIGPLGAGEHRFTLTHPDGRQWSGSAIAPAAGRARWVAP